MRLTHMAVEYDNLLSFVMNEDAVLSKIKLLGADDDSDIDNDPAARLDAEFVLMAGTLKNPRKRSRQTARRARLSVTAAGVVRSLCPPAAHPDPRGAMRIRDADSRPTDKKALQDATAFTLEELTLPVGFDALADHGQAKTLCQRNNRRTDSATVSVRLDVTHERGIDLQRVDREPLKIAKRGIPGYQNRRRQGEKPASLSSCSVPTTERISLMSTDSVISSSMRSGLIPARRTARGDRFPADCRQRTPGPKY